MQVNYAKPNEIITRVHFEHERPGYYIGSAVTVAARFHMLKGHCPKKDWEIVSRFDLFGSKPKPNHKPNPKPNPNLTLIRK